MRAAASREPPALETEDAAPHAVQRYRHDGRVHVLHDPLHPAPEGKQLADARDLAFGKNADHFAVANRVAGGVERVEHFARPLLGRNRNRAEELRERLDRWLFVDVLEDEERDGRSVEAISKSASTTKVVADEKRAALCRECCRARRRGCGKSNASRTTRQGEAANREAGTTRRSPRAKSGRRQRGKCWRGGERAILGQQDQCAGQTRGTRRRTRARLTVACTCNDESWYTAFLANDPINDTAQEYNKEHAMPMMSGKTYRNFSQYSIKGVRNSFLILT